MIYDIVGIHDTIKNTAEKHLANCTFDCGIQNDFSSNYTYPLVYLELPFAWQEDNNTETYSITINVCDKIQEEKQRIHILSKTKQIACDIKQELDNNSIPTAGGNGLTIEEIGDDMVIGVRYEFQIILPRYTSNFSQSFKA